MQIYHTILEDLRLVMSLLQAELLIPQLEFLNEEGSHVELWVVSQIFVDTPDRTGLNTWSFQHWTWPDWYLRLQITTLQICGSWPPVIYGMYLSVSDSTRYLQKVTAIFPDGRGAALLKYQWKDAQFKCNRYYPLRSDGFVANSQFRSKLM